jgi:hypothetical protein
VHRVRPGAARSGGTLHGPSRSTPITVDTQPRSLADRVARKVLLLEGTDPQALFSLKGSLLLSAVRCVLVYAVLPASAALFGFSAAVAAPVGVVVSSVAIVLSIHSLRRVWRADWAYRWAYTAFIGLVLTMLVTFLVMDVRTILG